MIDGSSSNVNKQIFINKLQCFTQMSTNGNIFICSFDEQLIGTVKFFAGKNHVDYMVSI